jgi:TolA-binding protein
MKKWLSILLVLAVFAGLASKAEAISNLQMAEKMLTEIDRIGQIEDPKRQLQEIQEFMKRVQGFGLNQEQMQKVVEQINRLAFAAGNKWCVVEEIPLKNQRGAYYVGAYYTTQPPAGAKKIQ